MQSGKNSAICLQSACNLAICLQSACKLTFPACNLAIWLQSGCLTATSVQWPVPSKTAVHFTSALSIMRYGGNHQSPVRPDTNSLAITQGHDCQLSLFCTLASRQGNELLFKVLPEHRWPEFAATAPHGGAGRWNLCHLCMMVQSLQTAQWTARPVMYVRMTSRRLPALRFAFPAATWCKPPPLVQ